MTPARHQQMHMTPPPFQSELGEQRIHRGGQLVTPPVRSTAAQKCRENQLALEVANKIAKANKARLEEERKKKLEEEKEAAKAAEAEKIAEVAKQAESGKELLDLMEMEDDKSASLEGLVRDLERETEKATTSPQKKRSRNKEDTRTKTYATAASHMATLHQRSTPRVIVKGSAKLSGDDKAAQFIGLVGTLLMNGKMVDPFFVLKSTIWRGKEEGSQGWQRRPRSP